MTTSIGMAIKITKINREKISVLTGITPTEVSINDYFYFPYDQDTHTETFSEADFRKRYKFANLESEHFFVDVDTI